MAYFPQAIITEVEKVARFDYISGAKCREWNEKRKDGELRLLSGYCWSARNRSAYRQGFKTFSAAVRDAHYALIEHSDAPFIRSHLRLVRKAA